MIQTMEQSKDNVLGYRVVGKISKEDYTVLVPGVEAAVKQYGTIRLLIDLSGFKGEKADAWASDLNFGKEFKGNIERMALVGDQKWGKDMAKVAQPFYAQEIQWFTDLEAAWVWVKS